MTLATYSHVDISQTPKLDLTDGQKAAATTLTLWANGAIPGVYLYGPPGRGKTHLAMRAGYVMEEAGLEVLFLRVKDFLDELRGTDDGSAFNDRSPSAVRERAMFAPVLIMDDLGLARDTEFATEELTSLFKFRYDNRGDLSTLVTGNLRGSEIAGRYGAVLGSNIRGLCKSAGVSGRDLRHA